MKLYDTPMAPNPRRVRWFMAEKGIDDVEIVTLDLMKGEHRDPAYLDRAGLPNVPALELDNGVVVTESVAICRYLESRYPEPNLFGQTPEEAAVVEMWMRRGELLVSLPLMTMVRHSLPALAALETQKPELAEANRAGGLRGLKVLNRRLAGSEWLAGERFTIADIVPYCGLDFSRLVKFEIPEELPDLRRWAAAMAARPAATAGRPVRT
ncbi:glutathione S-transferase family protein [Phenylobacterium sp. VNQ135]|uniref:glutathione S-transferase family protein n=1 Tax=Phenylobacterium sp. VNQ135 TaxID=3400922 RepID=UPI003C04762F